MKSLKNKFKIIQKDEHGVAALLVVVVILAMTLSLGLAVAKFSVNELSLNLESDQAHQAIQIGEACVDEAIYRLKDNIGYTGGTITTIGNGVCTVTVTGGGSTRLITVAVTVAGITRNLVVNTALVYNNFGNAINVLITNWEEI
ncbi:hypothetical protein COY25_00540 [Candidatus Uhrbacteria bacterium CG_4_10_14_0_2_um_filter_41_7]|uniref:Type 4 fimbrial biogenesis protein PilX N-terminal domain-containing protein n=1 Tax=Candidatus Uhrbacteria bacterium CG_4_9_14_3_um_filter_41_35 TaxID=1975034 RepID=A0A2M7XFI4_9BACT|nr:MAG: hypothetical protein COY25_00540 [Candidatus Uhrbacteria bacterium CG_4_10_14_0_2_um_filter_41_7]PJA46621.1 MAG: hypothetical protein CO173_02535 [Candidatus Uhrbacteria bacterium CG_4_9_14_3_um_filter_41_35]